MKKEFFWTTQRTSVFNMPNMPSADSSIQKKGYIFSKHTQLRATIQPAPGGIIELFDFE